MRNLQGGAGMSGVAAGWDAIGKNVTDDALWEPVTCFADMPTHIQMLSLCLMGNVNVMLHGGTATGKTVTLKALAEIICFDLVKIFPHRYEANDMAGFPAVVGVSGEEQLRHMPHVWAKRTAESFTVVFVDEVSRADPRVQGAVMGFLDDNGLPEAGLYFGDGTRFVAAMNPAGYDAGSYDVVPPLLRRFLNVGWPADLDGMAKFVEGNKWVVFDSEIVPPKVEDFVAGYHRWRRITSDFVEAKGKKHLHRELSGEDTQKSVVGGGLDPGFGWPNMDSWKQVWRLLSMADHVGCSEETKENLVYCALGQGTGREFWSYQLSKDLPNIKLLLENPENFVVPQRDDQVHSVVEGVMEHLMDFPTGETLEQVVVLFTGMLNEQHDIVLPQLKKITQMYFADLSGGNPKNFVDVTPAVAQTLLVNSERYMESFRGAGIGGFMSQTNSSL